VLVGARRVRRKARHVLVGSRGPRRYLASGLDLPRFFEILEQRGVSYVVLRWFESLPQVDPGEDIDLLVADEHLELVRTLLVARPANRRSQKFDVYSVSGLPGSDFRGIPYYPPRFARGVLADAEWLRGRYRVPSPEHHFDSLAYHAVYHKGYASGLDDGVGSDRPRPASDHDYEEVLSKLAADVGLAVPATLDGLDLYLADKGLRPPMDTLERLVRRNPWIHDRFFESLPAVDPLWRGLAVFVLRERAEPLVDQATRELDRQGFEILEVIHLDAAQREAVSHRIRGGTWERGPWQVSGGAPSVYVLAYDAAPRVSTDDRSGANRRIPAAKADLRARLLHGVPLAEQYNPVHSSDNPRQALDYLEALGDPGVVERAHRLTSQLLGTVAFPYPVLRAFPAGARRAQVAVVEHPVHGASVCKIFRPGAARFFERELRARTELRDLPEVPELLESGDNWLLMPLYGDDGSHVRRRLPGRSDVQLTPQASRALARFARALHERGLFMLDLSTKNLLSDPVNGLKVLDLEFLQKYPDPAPSLTESYTFRGIPENDGSYDAPLMSPRALLSERHGNSVFHPAVTGLPVEDLLRPQRPDRTVRGSVVQLGWYGYFLSRASARALTRSSPVRGGFRVVRALQRTRRHVR
jgi:hypothetical protein